MFAMQCISNGTNTSAYEADTFVYSGRAYTEFLGIYYGQARVSLQYCYRLIFLAIRTRVQCTGLIAV